MTRHCSYVNAKASGLDCRFSKVGGGSGLEGAGVGGVFGAGERFVNDCDGLST